MFNLPQSTFGRRSFLRFSALSVAAGSFLMNPISKAVAQAVKEIEPFYWNACVINCGQRCPQRCFVKGGQVIRVETDNTAGDACDHRQIRACLRGRALRQRLYSPDRLKYPMKRVGERGEGKFERITWDEAIKTVADNLKRTVEKYGNESVYWQYCSGQQSLVNPDALGGACSTSWAATLSTMVLTPPPRSAQPCLTPTAVVPAQT